MFSVLCGTFSPRCVRERACGGEWLRQKSTIWHPNGLKIITSLIAPDRDDEATSANSCSYVSITPTNTTQCLVCHSFFPLSSYLCSPFTFVSFLSWYQPSSSVCTFCITLSSCHLYCFLSAVHRQLHFSSGCLPLLVSPGADLHQVELEYSSIRSQQGSNKLRGSKS